MSNQNKDFSLFALFTAGLALIPSATAALNYRQPVGANPSGNPIALPGLHSIVPVGAPYTITWQPTTAQCSTVDLVLLKGPSTNAVPYSVITTNLANEGTYSWVPESDLAPGTTGYGIQLICDQSGAYQYTTQFGISNPAYSSSSSSSSSATAYSSSSASSYSSSTSCSTSSSASSYSSSTSCSTSATSVPVPYNTTVISVTGTGTGSPYTANTTFVTPTAPTTISTYAVSATLTTPATGSQTSPSAPAQQTTNAGTTLGASAGAMLVAAGFAFFAL